MQYNIRWLAYSERDLYLELGKEVYGNPRITYPINLNPTTATTLENFLVPETVLGFENRKVLGVFDDQGRLVSATGVRVMVYNASWLLSWTVSNIKTARFIATWQEQLRILTAHFESVGINEFYVVSPSNREESYRRMMKWLRARYWTFVDTSVTRHTKPEFGIHWALMGQQLYNYDLNIRRYILKRGENV